MNRHTVFLELAAVGLDFRLTSAEQTRLDGHLAACPACRRSVEGFHRDAAAIAGLPEARLDPRRAATVLDAALHGPARAPLPVLRLALVAALIGALAIGAALVGAELLRRMTDDDLSVVPPVPTASPGPEASPESLVWTVTDLGQPGGFLDVAVGGPGLVAVGYQSWESPTRSVIWTSTDGSNWVPAPDQASLDVGRMSAVASGPAGLVAVGSPCTEGFCVGSSIWRSSDGSAWSLVAEPAFELSSVISDGSRYFAGGVGPGGDGAIIASSDGVTWNIVWEGPRRVPAEGDQLATRSVTAITPYGGGLAAWVSDPNELLLSADGSTWRSEPVGSDTTYVDALAVWGDGLLAAGREGDDGAIWLYRGGVWERVADIGPGEVKDVVDAGGMLLAAGTDDKGHPVVLTSRDARSWTPDLMPSDLEPWSLLTGMVVVANEVIGVGSTGGTGTIGTERLAVWRRSLGSEPPRSSPPPVGVAPTPLPDSVALPDGAIAVTRGSLGVEQWIELVDPADPATTRRLVDGADPAWPPDGNSLVYACPTDGNEGDFPAICSVDVTGPDAEPTLLVSEGDRPSVSPDGSRMTLHRGMIDLGATWLAAIDGSGLRELGPGDFSRWSPDEAWLAGMSEISSGIALRDPDSDGEHALVTGRDPAWSPDGGLIAFAFWDEKAGSVRTVDPVSGAVEVLFTAPPGDEVSAPFWLPDGRLVFVMAGDLWRLDPGSDRPAQLTAGLRIGVEHLANPLAVSPDGDWIAFVTDDPSGGRVGIASVDGGWRMLDLGPEPVTQLAWRPAGDPAEAAVGTSWRHVTIPDAADAMDGVIPGGPGFIAWGQVYGEPSRIWTSADGLTWQRATVDVPPDMRLDGDMPASITSVAPGGPGFMAVGYADVVDGRRGLVWTSVDGRSWDLLAADPSFESVAIGSVIGWDGDLLAYGVRSFGADGGEGEQLAWASSDGRAWRSLELVVPDGLRLGPVVTAGDGLWATGSPADGLGVYDWAEWRWLTSTDGRVWTATQLPYQGNGALSIAGALVTLVPPRWVTGDEVTGLPDPGLYRALDDTSWTPVSEVAPWGADLTEVGSTLVIVGDDADPEHQCPDACHPKTWRSTDGGGTWEAVVADDRLGTVWHVASLDDGTLVGVGITFGADDRDRSAVWVSLPVVP